MESDHEHSARIIEAAHAPLAAFARKSYGLAGRGVVLVHPPDLTGELGTSIVATTMMFQTLDELRRLTAQMSPPGREDADVLIGMLETYDPAVQAVVMVAVGKGRPITVKMRLDPPTLVDDARGVH